MRFLSICSGIEAASVAFHPLGWQALAFAEIEPFPCSLLAHHYPQVPNLGDLTRWREWSPDLLAQADVLCGGTPCQAFSVAGLRGSLSDERGNLTLTFCHLFDEIDRQRHLCGRPPAVCLWENVPGVLNTDDNAFGHFLAGLAGEDVPLTPPGARWTDAGYVRGPRRAIAWRTLDAQYFGLAQRRERVFVVASADPAFDPAAVLFELDGLRRDTPPRRGPGEGASCGFETGPSGGQFTNVAPTLDTRCKDVPIRNQLGLGVAERVAGVPEVANCLTRRMHKGLNTTLDEGLNTTLDEGQTPIVEVCAPLTGNAYADNASEESKLVPERRDLEPGRLGDEEMLPFTFKASHFTRGKDGAPSDLAPPLSADADKGDQDTLVAAPIAFPEFLSGTQCASAEDVSPVLQAQNPTAVAFQPGNLVRGAGSAPSMEVFPTLKSDHGRGKSDQDPHVAVEETFAFDLRGREGGAMPEGPHATANLRAGSGGSSRSYVAQKAESEEQRAESSDAFAFHENQRGELTVNDTAGSLKVGGAKPAQGYPAVAFAIQERAVCENPLAGPDGVGVRADDCAYTLEARQVPQAVAFEPSALRPSPSASQWRVRRLTPEECELLQGFPIGYTLIPGTSSKKRKGEDLSATIDYLMSLGVPRPEAPVLAHSPDGPRYKALGNSWAVPVARWISRRIDACAKALSRQ